MKLVSWNVNGLRAVITKGFEDFFKSINADISCIQETKMQLSGFKNRTGIRAWILSCINLNLTVLSGDVRELLLKCYNCLYITYVVAYLCCNSRHSNQNSRSFRSKIITGRIIFSSPPKSNASK